LETPASSRQSTVAMAGWKRTAVALRLFTMSATAILVAKDSPCGTSCGNVLDSTSPDDIMCDESRFTATSAGQVFQSCINCERESTYSSGNDTDLKWLLCEYSWSLIMKPGCRQLTYDQTISDMHSRPASLIPPRTLGFMKQAILV